MQDTNLKLYADILEVSQDLLEAAETHDVEELDELINKRNQMLKCIYAERDNTSEISMERTRLLQKLLELNQQTMQLVNQRKQDIAEKIKQIKHANKANKIYTGL